MDGRSVHYIIDCQSQEQWDQMKNALHPLVIAPYADAFWGMRYIDGYGCLRVDFEEGRLVDFGHDRRSYYESSQYKYYEFLSFEAAQDVFANEINICENIFELFENMMSGGGDS